MKPGDVLRLRKVRTYGDDPSTWSEWSPDRSRSKDLKRVFVCMILGTEAYEVINKLGERVAASLDLEAALNRLGWYSEEQLQKAKAPKKFMERLQKVVDA